DFNQPRGGQEKRPYPTGNFIREMVPGESILYFHLTSYYSPGALWCTDGTPGGTRVVVDNLEPGGFFRTHQTTTLGDDLFYFLTENGEAVLYRSNTGAPGEIVLRPTVDGTPIYYLDIVGTGETVFYFADASSPNDR